MTLVIGADDLTHPAIENGPGSPIDGMPILDVDRLQAVIVLRQSVTPKRP